MKNELNFESLYQEYKYLGEENRKLVALEISPKIESLYGLAREATKSSLQSINLPAYNPKKCFSLSAIPVWN